MLSDDPRAALARILNGLAVLASGADRDRVADLQRRLSEDRLRVLVVGEAKRGKSTFVNALLGRAVLPVGVTPVTALATTIVYGSPERVDATFADGATRSYELGALCDLVTEAGNPANRRGLQQVVVRLGAPLLSANVEIVDTPGTGSVYEHNTAEAESALERMDAAVFVLTADPPLSASERLLIERVANSSVRLFVVLNKADRLDAVELDEARTFAVRILRELFGDAVAVQPVSARHALDGHDLGFEQFRRRFESYLRDQRDVDLRVSLARHARSLAGEMLDEVRLVRGATAQRGADAAGRVAAFQQRVAAVDRARQDAVDLVRAESRRLLGALNAAADLTTRDHTGQIRQATLEHLSTELADHSAAEIERGGRDHLVRLTTEALDGWREQQAAALEAGLADLDARLTTALERDLADLREAAAALLSVELSVPEQPPRLVPDVRFFYTVAETVGQTELLAGAVRRHLPGSVGRRRATDHVMREVDDMVAKQVGRSRADLQQRLAETTRRFVRVVDDRYARTVVRLAEALEKARSLDALTGEESARTHAELGDRAAAAAALVEQLDQLGGPPVPVSAACPVKEG